MWPNSSTSFAASCSTRARATWSKAAWGNLPRTRAASYRELCQRARATSDPRWQQKIINAITTQETLFFRDSSPFDALQNRILPDLIDACTRGGGPRKLRFWSAASSTGQEAYSLAMVLRETIPNLASWNVTILATDISDAAIAQASRGWYAAHEIERGMRGPLLAKYFQSRQGGWQVKDEIRGMVSFQRRNLLQPFTELGTFDVIFCRNVAIYFDGPRRRDLFLRLADRLAPPGRSWSAVPSRSWTWGLASPPRITAAQPTISRISSRPRRPVQQVAPRLQHRERTVDVPINSISDEGSRQLFHFTNLPMLRLPPAEASLWLELPGWPGRFLRQGYEVLDRETIVLQENAHRR